MKIKFILIMYTFLCLQMYSQVTDVMDASSLSIKDRKILNIHKEGIEIEYSNKNYFLAIKPTKYGIYDKNYSLIIPCEYDGIISLFETNDSIAVVRKNSKFFAINKKNIIISKLYDYMDSPNAFDLLVVKLDEKYTFITAKGKESTSWYDKNLYFNGEYCVVTNQNKCGLIDKNQKIIIPLIYDDLIYDNNANQICAKKDKYGIINLQNQIIIPFLYDGIDIFFDNDMNNLEYKVKIDHKFGIINKENKLIINPLYDDIYPVKESYRKAQKGKYYGLLNKFGFEIIPFEYDRIYKYENKERFKICKNELCGIIDLSNDLKLPIIYKEISNFSYQKNNEYAKTEFIYKVSIDGKKNIIVDDNNLIIKE